MKDVDSKIRRLAEEINAIKTIAWDRLTSEEREDIHTKCVEIWTLAGGDQ